MSFSPIAVLIPPEEIKLLYFSLCMSISKVGEADRKARKDTEYTQNYYRT